MKERRGNPSIASAQGVGEDGQGHVVVFLPLLATEERQDTFADIDKVGNKV